MFKSKKTLLLMVFLFVIIGVGAAFLIAEFFSGKSKETLDYSKDITDIQATRGNEYENELKENSNDIVISGGEQIYGKEPVTIIAYDSFSCAHCAFFYENVFPSLKKDYIDSGRVKFIHRDFPLDVQALTATKLLKCFAQNNSTEKVVNVILAVYETQKDWAGSDSYKQELTKIFEFAGMPSSEASECIADEELENRVLEDRVRAAKLLKITGTPTFFINGKRLVKEHSFGSFVSEIDEISK
jgi:protein-disulfide isomerase